MRYRVSMSQAWGPAVPVDTYSTLGVARTMLVIAKRKAGPGWHGTIETVANDG